MRFTWGSGGVARLLVALVSVAGACGSAVPRVVYPVHFEYSSTSPDLQAAAAEPRPVDVAKQPIRQSLPLVYEIGAPSEKVEKVLRQPIAFSYNDNAPAATSSKGGGVKTPDGAAYSVRSGSYKAKEGAKGRSKQERVGDKDRNAESHITEASKDKEESDEHSYGGYFVHKYGTDAVAATSDRSAAQRAEQSSARPQQVSTEGALAREASDEDAIDHTDAFLKYGHNKVAPATTPKDYKPHDDVYDYHHHYGASTSTEKQAAASNAGDKRAKPKNAKPKDKDHHDEYHYDFHTIGYSSGSPRPKHKKQQEQSKDKPYDHDDIYSYHHDYESDKPKPKAKAKAKDSEEVYGYGASSRVPAKEKGRAKDAEPEEGERDDIEELYRFSFDSLYNPTSPKTSEKLTTGESSTESRADVEPNTDSSDKSQLFVVKVEDSEGDGSVQHKAVDQATAQSKGEHHEDHKYEKGGGKTHDSEHHDEKGDHDKKDHKGEHKHHKVDKGHHHKKGDEEHHKEEGGHKNKHHEDHDHHHEHHEGDEGQKGAKYDESGEHQKGHSTKGEHNIHKKDEYEKRHEFYDEHHEGGEHEKHGGFHEDHGHKKGGHKKGDHHHGHHHEGDHGKKGHHEKGGHHSHHSGHKKGEGHEGHHDHGGHHHKKGSHAEGKKWGHKSSHQTKHEDKGHK